MRISFFLVFSSLFSCMKKPEKQWTLRNLTLINNIGIITIALDADLDTLHSWNQVSDYKCGDLKYYRFQSHKFPMIEERDYLPQCPDSMYGLTITHILHQECNTLNIEFKAAEVLSNQKEHLYTLDTTTIFKIMETKIINGLPFAICATITKFKHIEQNLFASTMYKDNFINFNFKKTSSSISDSAFIKDSYAMLMTFQIK